MFSKKCYIAGKKGKIGYWEVKVVGNTLEITHARDEADTPVTRFVSCKGKNKGKVNETTDEQQAILEAVSRYKKQKDKGYVDSIEQTKEGVKNSAGGVKPMLAMPIEKCKHIDFTQAFVQPKLDGHRCLFSNSTGLYSRGGKSINLPHIEDYLRSLNLPDEVILDGELYCHGKSLQEISSLVKAPRAESKQLNYIVYDLVSSSSYEERFIKLEEYVPNLIIHINQKVTTRQEVEVLTDSFIKLGYESAMLRHGSSGYEVAKRSPSLLKVKRFEDTEYDCVSFSFGESYKDGVYEYLTPILHCLTECGKEFTVTAQGNVKEKHELGVELLNSFTPRKLTVKHFGVTPNGIPYLPVALRWREDV